MAEYLFLDRQVVNPQSLENAVLQVCHPEKDAANNPLFVQDRPWEIRIDNGYPNVLFDESTGLYHCFYTLFTDDEDTENSTPQERAARSYVPLPSRVTSLAYAVSEDGIRWEKPALGRVLWRGSTENNIMFRYVHGAGVMIDAREADAAKRFKLVAKIDVPGKGTGMASAFSPDGRTWSALVPWECESFAADSHNFPYYDEAAGMYRVMTRMWKDGVRVAAVCESSDFIHWSNPVEAFRGEGFGRQIYSMPVAPYGKSFLGFPSIYHEGDRGSADFDKVDVELAWSNDGVHFDFVSAGQPFVERGEGTYPVGAFDNSCIYASSLVTDAAGETWLYYMGGNGSHTDFRESSLGRAKVTPGCFAAYAQRMPSSEGTFSTSELKFTGEPVQLLVSATTDAAVAAPKLAASLRPKATAPAFPGFEEAKYAEVQTLGEQPKWIDLNEWSADIATLAGAIGQLVITFENLKLWAIRGGIALGSHRLWEGADETALLPLDPDDFSRCTD